jgi:hypothetical protein
VNGAQLEIEVLYNLQFESTSSMFDLRDVMTYLAQRVGLIPGRVWFGAGNAVNVTLTAKQQRNFQRFLNRHRLKPFLVVDNLHRGGKPALRIGMGPIPGRPEIEVDPRSPFADQLLQVTA